VFFGMWGDTATADVDVETNFIKMISHAGTTVDYGLNIESSSDMDAGILLNNHSSNEPATMDVGIEMISAASKMVYGIDMSAASFTGADIRLDHGESIDNATDGIVNVTGNLQVNGTVNYDLAATTTVTYVLDYTPNITVAEGVMVTFSCDSASGDNAQLSVDGVVDNLMKASDPSDDIDANDLVIKQSCIAIFDVDGNWQVIGE